MIEVTATERLVLNDLQDKTGSSFPRLGGINTRERSIAERTFPVLAEWASKTGDARIRHAIYACFDSPFAYPFLDQLLSWWTKEEDSLASGSLTQTIAALARVRDAERIWALYQHAPRRPFHYLLMAALSKFPSVESAIKNSVLDDLRAGRVHTADLQYVAGIADQRIRDWFAAQTQSPDRVLRILANKVASRGARLPRGIERATSKPDRTREIFSTEIDVENVDSLLRRLTEDYSLRLPAGLRRPRSFLSSLDRDNWFLADVCQGDGKAVLWFRLEDLDTVEVVLIEGNSGNSGQA